MSLEIIERVGTSTRSGAPIFKVRCPVCREEYRFTGWNSAIKKTKSCSQCAPQLSRNKKEDQS